MLTAEEIDEIEATPENLEKYFPATRIGPVWQEDEDLGGWLLPDRTIGWHVLEWIHANLIDFKGEGPFQPTGEQARFLLWWYALDENNRFAYRMGILQRLKGWGKDPLAAVLCIVELIGPSLYSHDENGIPRGKANKQAWVALTAVSLEQPLALDHRVRTPDGWVALRDLHVGDYVYDENGLPRRVERETEVYNDKECYEVEFKDGQKIIASANHGWTVNMSSLHDNKPVRETVTTEDIFNAVNRARKRSVSVDAAPIHMDDRDDLLIDPYLLGYWLGDGCSANSSIYVGREDEAHLAEQMELACADDEHVTRRGSFEVTGAVRYTIVKNRKPGNGKVESFYQKLRHLDLINNKHIPERYLFAGDAQRRALLQGMVDSDGGCENGHVRFTNKNPRLIDGFVELARSLGYVPTVGKAFGGARYAAFANHGNERVARLDRKNDRAFNDSPRYRNKRYVKAVRKVESVPVKCIGIDTPEHLFQVEGGILTHNTTNTRAMFKQIIPKKTRLKYSMDIQNEIIYANGGKQRLKAYGSNARTTEGMRITFLLCNETQHWLPNNGGREFYDTMIFNADKVGGRVLCITNAYNPGEQSVAEIIREGQEKVWEGRAEDSRTLYDSIEAHPAAPLSSKWAPLVFSQIRGDAYWLDWDNVKSSFLRLDVMPSRKRRMWYNQIVSTEESLFDKAEIDAVTNQDMLGTSGDLQDGEEITLGFDGGRTDDATALVAFRCSDKTIIPIKIWEKPDEIEHWRIDADSVSSTVHWCFKKFKVRAFYADVNLWESYINAWSEAYRERLERKASPQSAIGFDMRGNRKIVSRMNEDFLAMIRDRGLRLNGNKTLQRHMLNAEAYLDEHDGLYFRKKGGRESHRKIDALVAATLAYKAYKDLVEGPIKKSEKQYRRRLIT